ncbi:MAG: hypothetical protein GWP08_05250 [Nitrospiraceae bacterium]|nr:hypothetical protein [Nitrospiraceae bacterium]
MKWSLPALAINRPVTTVMMLLTVLALGAVAYTRIPLEFMPNIDYPFVMCWISLPASTPAQVEKDIAIPAEGEFLTIPRIERIQSWSRDDGCFIFMQFEWETDMSEATAEVRDRIERLKLRLPDEVERLYLRRSSPDDWAVMWMGLFRGDDPDEAGWLARTVLQPKLERIDGVAEVGIRGQDMAGVYIEFDQEALKSLDLSLYEVIETLRTSSLNISIGKLTDGPIKYFVRAEDQFTTLSQIEDVVVGDGGLRVKDIAEVCMKPPEEDRQFTMDGKRGVFLFVKKESRANAVRTCNAVRETLAEVSTDPSFRDVQIEVFDDMSEDIRFSLAGLVMAGRYGGSLALVILFVFLRRFRATFLVASAIPASLTVAIIFMFFNGSTFNIVTISGMIVVIGMLVDNSIVVMENIDRHHRLDPDRPMRDSALRGAREVALAITTATLTTIIVFIPVMYMGGDELGMLLKDFAGPVCMALLASLVLALTMIPLAASHLYASGDVKPRGLRRLWMTLRNRVASGGVPGRFLRFHPFKKFVNAYVWVLRLSLQRRMVALLLIGLLGYATYAIPFPKVGMQQQPTMDNREVDIFVRFHKYNKEKAKETFVELEKSLNKRRDELGIRGLFVNHGPWGGHIEAHLVRPDEIPVGEKPPFTSEEVRNILSQTLPERIPGADFNFGMPRSGDGDTSRIMLGMRGDDADTVAQYAERLARVLKSVPEVLDCKTERDADKQEIAVSIDETFASAMGVNPTVVARTLGFALSGTRLPYLKQGGREIPVWARFQEADRSTKEDLDNIAVLTTQGGLVPLDQLVTTSKTVSPPVLKRESGKSVTYVSVEVNTKDMTRVRQAVEKVIASFVLPRGYSVDMGTMLRELEETQKSFNNALSLAVILMYLLMAALFESFLLPLSILTTVPLAFIGVYWSMYLTGTPLDSIALIGAILMCGIIVNNGIVIVDHVNQLRRLHGLPRTQALLQAGRDRLRPVLMTALTTVLGCVPLAIGTGSGQDRLYSMGRALVGGLTMGTLLTLFIVPLFYTLIDDMQSWILHYLGNLARIAHHCSSRERVDAVRSRRSSGEPGDTVLKHVEFGEQGNVLR